MVIFHGYVKLPGGMIHYIPKQNPYKSLYPYKSLLTWPFYQRLAMGKVHTGCLAKILRKSFFGVNWGQLVQLQVGVEVTPFLNISMEFIWVYNGFIGIYMGFIWGYNGFIGIYIGFCLGI